MEEVGRFADISTPSTVKTSGAASDIERLCLKLKIPEPQHYKEKEENKEEEEEEVVLPFACPLCDKSFNSGKALGGHKRIHNQQPTTTTFTSNIYSSNGSIGNFNDKATKDQTGSRSGTNNCPMCLKIFPSKMSLFGHMRSHPERSWRGIEPPATGSPPLLLLPKPTCTSTSSTDHDHDHDHQVLDHDDHDRIIIDLAAAPPLVNWGVTAKRGRKSLTRSATSISPAAASAITTASASHDDSDSSARSASEDRMKKAALDLMALARASPAATNYNNRPAPPKDHKNIIFKKRKFAEYSDCHSSQNNGIQVRMQKPKLVTKASSASGPCKYVCSVCERSFPCYQALGGHMSIHKKAAPATAPAPAPRLLNIDLNQPPPPHDDDVDDHQWPLVQQFS